MVNKSNVSLKVLEIVKRLLVPRSQMTLLFLHKRNKTYSTINEFNFFSTKFKAVLHSGDNSNYHVLETVVTISSEVLDITFPPTLK